MMDISEVKKAELRLECARIAFNETSKHNIDKGTCIKIAGDIYKFVIEGNSEESLKTD